MNRECATTSETGSTRRMTRSRTNSKPIINYCEQTPEKESCEDEDSSASDGDEAGDKDTSASVCSIDFMVH